MATPTNTRSQIGPLGRIQGAYRESVEHKGETFTFVNVGVSNAVNYAVLKRTDTNDKRTFEAVKLAEVQPSERK